jgi:hypothetical protein
VSSPTKQRRGDVSVVPGFVKDQFNDNFNQCVVSVVVVWAYEGGCLYV